MKLEKGYENDERKIVTQATNNGVSFEKIAEIKQRIKAEGLKDYEFIQMLKGKLRDETDAQKK